jgi:tripartite-type tricarboxylate transporter receptor subunit TctC
MREQENEEDRSMRNTTCWTVVPVVVLGLMAPVEDTKAQSYPVKAVRIIVPTSPGGGNDFVARHVGQRLGDRLGQQFIVENRPGAGGTIGTALAAKAAPDGYTLLLGFVGQLAMSPHVEKGLYDPLKDFVGVSLLASSYHVLAVHPSLPVRSVKELIAFAKKRPGELNYASGNIWTPTHLVPELFKSATGVDIVAIQYKGSGPAAVGVLTGEAQVVFASVTALMPYVRSKRLLALGVTSPKRSPIAPEVPTLVELGVRGVEAPSWYSIVAPSATPRDIVGRLNGEIAQFVSLPDYRAPLERQALEPTTSTPEQFAVFLQAEYDKWGKVIKALRLH